MNALYRLALLQCLQHGTVNVVVNAKQCGTLRVTMWYLVRHIACQVGKTRDSVRSWHGSCAVLATRMACTYLYADSTMLHTPACYSKILCRGIPLLYF